MIRAVLLFVIALAPQLASAVTCEDTTYDGNRYTLCSVNAGSEDLRLFLRGPDEAILGQFRDVEKSLSDTEQLVFAMNAGMYHADRTPVGHYVEDGVAQSNLLTKSSPGNFGLLPNGVFCIRDGRADVIETLRFANQPPSCRYATQSGPMLVIDGALHPRFLVDSKSRFLRNGVGTSRDGQTVTFVISNTRVTFHAFGRFFRDVLKTPNALYFDGKISRLHAPDLNRSDSGFWIGPIVGVVAAKAARE